MRALIAISIIVFVIIQLPPGDYLEKPYRDHAGTGRERRSKSFLREQYGLDQPMWKQYLTWATGFVQGDLGYSFEYDLPVTEVVGDRMFLTILISVVTIIWLKNLFSNPSIQLGGLRTHFYRFHWARQPNFLLALVMLYLANVLPRSEG